ncbi:MAG TPA: phosphoglycerate kinase [Candidatus Paceibacterota bacterium]
MRSITEAGDLKGKRVLVRVDWSDGDSFRINSSQNTIKYLLDAGAKVILATHIDQNTEDLAKFVPEGAELLPNLRDNAGEEANSEEFAIDLAVKADIYVNEAFSASHRKHASIVGVPKLLPSYAGIRFLEELKALGRAFNPPHPFLLILAGVKFETKLPLVEKFLNIADTIFIGGAIAKNVSIENPKIILSTGDLSALDANEETLNLLREKILGANFIVWNGPLGKYEEGYTKYTHELARVLAGSGKDTIIGGGDTLKSIEELNILEKFSFVSTGGGAMLDFLAEGTLPGIEALK